MPRQVFLSPEQNAQIEALNPSYGQAQQILAAEEAAKKAAEETEHKPTGFLEKMLNLVKG